MQEYDYEVQELFSLLILYYVKKYERIDELNYNIKSIIIKALWFNSIQSKLSHNLKKIYAEVILIDENKFL